MPSRSKKKSIFSIICEFHLLPIIKHIEDTTYITKSSVREACINLIFTERQRIIAVAVHVGQGRGIT